MVSVGPLLFGALEEGALLITANVRLSRWVRGVYSQHRRAGGAEVWATPEILPLSAWLRRCWEQAMERGAVLSSPGELLGLGAGDGAAGKGAAGKRGTGAGGGAVWGAPPVLLSDAQGAVVWERVVAAERGGADLLRPAAAAEQAARAWALLRGWRLRLTPGEADSEESRALLRWSEAFGQACAAGGLVPGPSLAEVVAGWLEAGALAAPQRVLLAGFDETTPAQRRLWEAMARAGCQLEEVAPPALTPRRAVVAAFPDAEAEMEAAARWARGWLERGGAADGAGNGGPDGHLPAGQPAGGPGGHSVLAVVVPELNALRGGLARIFRDVLAPGSALPVGGDGEGGEAPFNISKGPPLGDYPLVATALALLGMGVQPPPVGELGRLLRSPFLAGAEAEFHQRALLDARLRDFGRLMQPVGAIARLAAQTTHRGQASPWHAPVLAERLARWERAFRDARGLRQSPSAWAATFTELLQLLGWPGERTLDGTEFQAREKFLEVLSELAALEPVLPRAAYGEALGRLARLAAETEFQPDGGAGADSPVQVLGELEAGGMAFAGLWVLGVHDGVWPPPARPNPFLPIGWQRRHGLPHSSPERELAYARRVTGRLLGAAEGEVVVGWPRQEEDRPLRPSPLVAHLPVAETEALGLSGVPSPWQVVAGDGALETLADHTAPPLAAGSPVRGGSSLFKDQAACPFRAFATHRLHAGALEEPTYGLDPRERGTLAHKVMERVWARLLTHAGLAALAAPALAALVLEEAGAVVGEFAARAGMAGPRFAAIERARITRLALAGLEQERARAPFAVVAREDQRTFTIGGLEVNTRIDRIDEVPGVGSVVIDYKTGTTRTGDWFGPRPEEPQLPLYCSSGAMAVAGVAFLQLRVGETGFHGLESQPGIFPGATPLHKLKMPPGEPAPQHLEEVRAGWRANLEHLAAAFRAGDARVDPKNPDQTCTYCDLPLLCRIAETGSGLPDREGAAEGWEGEPRDE